MNRIKDSFYKLTRGNERFVSGDLLHPSRDEAQRLATLNYGQAPYAAILSCADSRVPAEVIFDLGIGELFSVRNAGNVCDDSIIGSLEICVEEFGTPVIVCMGHTHCGAIKIAMSDESANGSIGKIIDKIHPIIESLKTDHPDWDDNVLLLESIKANAINSAGELYGSSDLIRNRVDNGRLKLEAAIYYLETGEVEFLEFEPGQ